MKDENLLTPFQSAGWVYYTINRFNNLAGSISTINKQINLGRLQKLYETLITHENVVYSKLGISDASGLRVFQQKADRFANETGADILLSSDFIKELYLKVAEKLKASAVQEELQDILDEAIKQDQVVNEKTVVEIVNEFFDKNGGKVANFKHFSNKGLDYIFTVIPDNDGQLKIQTTGNSEFVSSALADKLATGVKNINNKNISALVPKIAKGWREVIDIIKEQPGASKLGNYLDQEKGRLQILNKEPYAYFTNYITLQGFLGELYWNMALTYIFGNPNIIPVGNLTNSQSKSLSVDTLVFKYIGCQIKHWHSSELKNGKTIHTTKGDRLADTLLIDNMGLGEYNGIGQLLLQIFGIWKFNEPIDKATTRYQTTYQVLDSEFANGLSRLTELFQSYIDRIIRIDNGGGIDGITADALGTNQNNLLNTFWLINNKIYPSSMIIKNLMERIDSSEEVEALTSFRINKITDTKPDLVWGNQESKKKKKKTALVDENNGSLSEEPKEYSPRELASKVRVYYTITFNLDEMLNKLASM